MWTIISILSGVSRAFAAMTSSRPYRKGMEPEVAIAEIKRCSGTQFDPKIADSFLEVWNAGGLEPILLKGEVKKPAEFVVDSPL